jgi:hypothetical protein
MVAILAHGENAFRLVNGVDQDVGWVRSRAIGFGGFHTKEAACDAAVDGARVLATALKREFGVAHLEVSDRPRARVVRDGTSEWIVDGQVRLARLLRDMGDGHDVEFAIEFVLPPYATEGVAISAAQIVYGVLGPGLTGSLDLRVVETTPEDAA